MPGIPVVISTNGRGVPVKQVSGGAPVMTVASNGLGIPIVLSERGTPFVVQGTYDPDASALFNRFSTQPDASRKQLINSMFISGKSYSFWGKLDSLWVHAAHDSQAARLNWIGNIYNCIPVNNPSFTVDRGYMGDGTSSYLDTQFNPSNAVIPKFTLNSACLGIRSNTNNSGTGSLAGFYGGSFGTTINPRDTSDRAASRINGNSISQTATSTIFTSVGMYVTNVLSGTQKLHKDGVLLNSTAHLSPSIADGAMRLGSISASSYRACQFSMGFIGSGLTDQEAMDAYNWFEPYRSALGII